MESLDRGEGGVVADRIGVAINLITITEYMKMRREIKGFTGKCCSQSVIKLRGKALQRNLDGKPKGKILPLFWIGPN